MGTVQQVLKDSQGSSNAFLSHLKMGVSIPFWHRSKAKELLMSCTRAHCQRRRAQSPLASNTLGSEGSLSCYLDLWEFAYLTSRSPDLSITFAPHSPFSVLPSHMVFQ